MPNIFERALNKIDENRGRENNSIPFGFERFEEFLPGIMQKTYYLITANSGVGKSQITDEMFLYAPYDFIKTTETDIKLKIFFNSLEMDKESKIIQGITRQIFKRFGVVTDPNTVLSFGKNKISQELYDMVLATRKYFEEMEDIVEFIDEPQNPYGIFKRVSEYCTSVGTVYKKKILRNIKEESTGVVTQREEEIFDYYKPNNDREFVINLTDHLAELSSELGLDLKHTIEKHSDNNRLLRNKYSIIPVDVQQQNSLKEEQQFTFKGQTIESKLEPSLDALAESKLTQRKVNVVLGLFGPNRFELPVYRGYNITKWQDNYRSLKILKNRNGQSNVRTHLYFNGACNYWKELPKADQFDLNPSLYKEYGK